MPTRETIPVGAPCWVDLMTSDTARSRDFYCALFGWTATALARKARGTVATITLLGAAQLVMHLLLTTLAEHHGMAAMPGSGTGPGMVVAHAVATLLTALLLARADATLLAVLAVLRAILPRLLTPLPVPAAAPALVPARTARLLQSDADFLYEQATAALNSMDAQASDGRPGR